MFIFIVQYIYIPIINLKLISLYIKSINSFFNLIFAQLTSHPQVPTNFSKGNKIDQLLLAEEKGPKKWLDSLYFLNFFLQINFNILTFYIKSINFY
jgi:hypothetical protein